MELNSDPDRRQREPERPHNYTKHGDFDSKVNISKEGGDGGKIAGEVISKKDVFCVCLVVFLSAWCQFTGIN